MIDHGYQRTRTTYSAQPAHPAGNRWPSQRDTDDTESTARLAEITEFYRQAATVPADGIPLAAASRNSIGEVLARHLTPWSAGDIKHQLMASGVLSAMAQDKLVCAAALEIAVAWARDGEQEQAVTAAIAFGGPLGLRYLDEALLWLWVLTLREGQASPVAQLALGQLFAAEIGASTGNDAVARFLVGKIRPLLNPEAAAHERQAALSAVNFALNSMSAGSATPAVARLVRARHAGLPLVAELWATVLNSVPHRRMAVIALHLTLAALTDHADAVEVAANLGKAILPRLTSRTREVIVLTLPDPQRPEEISARVMSAFLGAQREMVGASR